MQSEGEVAGGGWGKGLPIGNQFTRALALRICCASDANLMRFFTAARKVRKKFVFEINLPNDILRNLSCPQSCGAKP